MGVHIIKVHIIEGIAPWHKLLVNNMEYYNVRDTPSSGLALTIDSMDVYIQM